MQVDPVDQLGEFQPQAETRSSKFAISLDCLVVGKVKPGKSIAEGKTEEVLGGAE